MIEISTPGKSLWDPPPPPLLPLDGFCLEERCYSPSSPSGVHPLLHGVLVPVHRWLPLMKFSSPPYPALPLHLAYVCHGRHSVPFAQGGRSAFQGLCEVPFRLDCVVLSGNTSVSNFSTSSSFRIRKSSGRGYSSQSSQAFGLPSPSYPPSTTLLVFVPLLGYSYTHCPLSTSSAGTLLLPFPRSIFCRYTKTHLSYARPFGIANAALAHPLATPHKSHLLSTFSSCHRAPLRPPAPLRCVGPYSHFLAQANPRHLSDVNFLCQGFIHSLCFYTFIVDVTKGSPLIPACFFPFHSLQMYAYVCRIWLGDRWNV